MESVRIDLRGAKDRVLQDLREQPSDTPETEIRRAIADYIEANVDDDTDVRVYFEGFIDSKDR